jgi:hypothetical protein
MEIERRGHYSDEFCFKPYSVDRPIAASQLQEENNATGPSPLQQIVKRIAVCHYIRMVIGQEQQNLLSSQRLKASWKFRPHHFFSI